MMIGSFPLTIYFFSISSPLNDKKKRRSLVMSRNDNKSIDLALVEINRGINAKTKELREIEVRILQNKGSILKLEEDKKNFVYNLESLQGQISGVIKKARDRKNQKISE
jgi:hypothetical protein